MGTVIGIVTATRAPNAAAAAAAAATVTGAVCP